MKIISKALNSIPRPILIKLSYWLRPVIALLLKGSNYTDPIDGKSYRKFLPYGYETIRENVLAPGTLSLERHRLFWLYLKNETDFFSNEKKIKLLHFAPEQAFYSRFKQIKYLEYITTDLNSPLAAVKADICKLPFKDNEFDYIFCNHVLEHIPDDKKAMEELYRVLKKGGTLIAQVPLNEELDETFEDDTITDKKERTRIFGQYDHVRVYGKDYYTRLNTVGFESKGITFINTMSIEEIDRFGLPQKERIPVAVK